MALKTGLVSYYKLDEITGTTATDAHGSNNGTANNARVFTTEVAGIISTGADFTGGVDDITFSGIGSDSGTWSVSFWIKGSNTTDTQYIIDNRPDGGNGNIIIRFATDLQLVDSNNDVDTLDAIGDVLDGTWNHVAITGNGTTAKYYLNGSQVGGDITITSSDFGSTDNLVLGGIRPDGGSSSTDADFSIDELGFWNKELSSSEVTELYNSGNGLSYDNFDSITITPSALNLTTSLAASEDVVIHLSSAFNMILTFEEEETLIIPPSSTISVGGFVGIGHKELKTEYPITEGLEFGTTKQQDDWYLRPEINLVPIDEQRRTN